MWSPSEESPTPTDGNISGRWIEVADPETSVVRRPIPCWDKLEFLVIVQEDERLRALVAHKEAAMGMEPRSWMAWSEETVGTLDQGHVVLEGARVTRGGRVDSTESWRRFEPVTYELRFEPTTTQLVGTRNGNPLRLAPLFLEPMPEDCGDGPP